MKILFIHHNKTILHLFGIVIQYVKYIFLEIANIGDTICIEVIINYLRFDTDSSCFKYILLNNVNTTHFVF